MRNGLTRAQRCGAGILGALAVVAGAAAVSLPTSPVLAKAKVRPTEKVGIDVVRANGSGCRKETAAVGVSPDNMAFTVSYSEYLVQVGVGAKPGDARKNCKLNLKVNVPKDFTYSIERVDYRGFAHLEAGATAWERGSYDFPGSSKPTTLEHRFTGPHNDNWQASDLGSALFAPCGKQFQLNIDTVLEVSAGTSNPKATNSFMSLDSTDGAVDSTYRLAWKKCS